MLVALCQINTTVGDLAGNCRKIVEAAHQAKREGAHVAVFPELAICGYPPQDLLLRRSFVDAHDRALDDLAASLPPDLCVLVGCLERHDSPEGGRPLFNAVALIEDGIPRIVGRKTLLPTYDVFDESRFFHPCADPAANLVTIHGVVVGIAVCEDLWNDARFFTSRRYAVDPVEQLVDAGAELILSVSASPWDRGKERFRVRMLRAAAKRHDRRIIMVNQVGGNVDLQFDGSSLAAGPVGLGAVPVIFDEAIQVVDTEAPWQARMPERPDAELHYRALVQGLRDYGKKFGFDRAVLGLSGGIDSAVTAVLAADAFGSERVTGIAMPSRYSSDHSVEDAAALARNLGLEYHEIPIRGLQDAFDGALAAVFEGTEPGVAEENVQARSRGVLLMAYANKFGHMLLTTGNKSEAAVGYCTLYGDMCGALAVIADLWKVEVYDLARWINRDGERIPVRSIDKPPSAELRPDQLDTDSLPPYEELDPVLRMLVEDERPVADVVRETGMDRQLVARLQRMVMANEFKRYQYAPTLRVTSRSWGGRQMPVAHRFRED